MNAAGNMTRVKIFERMEILTEEDWNAVVRTERWVQEHAPWYPRWREERA